MTQTKVKISDLELREILPTDDPATISTLCEKEAVHPMDCAGMELSNFRLAPNKSPLWDKHCFGLFVPGTDTPVAAVYTKFLYQEEPRLKSLANSELPGDIFSILHQKPKKSGSVNTAIFYTITNLSNQKDGTPDPAFPYQFEKGESRRSIGEELIAKTAMHLQQAPYGITTFSTLSPLRRGMEREATGFAQWLQRELAKGETRAGQLMTMPERRTICYMAQEITKEPSSDLYAAIALLHQNYGKLHHTQQRFFSELMRDLGAHYLIEERMPTDPKQVLDPVERFHLSNGAMLANIHYRPPELTTPSESIGALGLMANYKYDLRLLQEHKTGYKIPAIVVDAKLGKQHETRRQKLEKPTAKVENVIPENVRKLYRDAVGIMEK